MGAQACSHDRQRAGEARSWARRFNLAFELFDLDSDNNHRKVIMLLSDGGNDAGLDALNDIVKQLRERNIELVICRTR